MAIHYNFHDDQTMFEFMIRAALIKCMHKLGISKVEVSRSELESLIDKEVSLSISDRPDLYDTRIIVCPELAKAQKENKKLQLPWDENKNESENEEIEITIEET